jgi:high-affinity nickel-transport protein
VTSFVGLMLLGLFLGVRHATDPDHVIAVTTIVSRQRSPFGAALIGAAWGLGHTLTILLVGGGIILFGWVIPPRVGLSTELSVGVMLIILGLISLVGAARSAQANAAMSGEQSAHVTDSPVKGSHVHPHPVTHSHAHAHGDFVHTHPHSHDPDAHPHREEQTPVGLLDRHFGRLGIYQLVRPLLVGVVHGLAGSAAVALLVLATIHSPRWAMLYLLVFGGGTIVGMMLMTALIGLPFAYSSRQFARLNWGLRVASGVISVGFGLFVAYRIGIVQGLFTGNPQWIPE